MSAPKLKGDIQLDSWSWEAGNAPASATGGTSGNAAAQDFQFTSKIGKAVVKLQADFAMAAIIPKVVLSGRKHRG
jgi:type VI protein secretion system component Hcp